MGKGGGQSAPQQGSSSVYQTSIPEYAQPYVQNMLNATQSQLFNTDSSGNVTGFNKYQPYTGMSQQDLQNASQAVAGFTPMQQQAQQSAANLKSPEAYNQAQNALLGLGNTASTQQFMNPYIQASLQPQLAEMQRQYGITGAQEQGQATNAGAFGGSREALMAAENQRNKNMAMNQAIGQGFNTAFNNAQQLQTTQAQGLGQLGGQQLAAQQGIINMQNQMGTAQQARDQQIINQGIQNYATAQQYPLMQLGTMSNMLRGLPMQAATTQQYQAAPNPLSQAVGAAGALGTLSTMYAKGGKVNSYAKGGITSYAGGEEVVDSLKNDLYDMDPQQLKNYISKSSSPMAKQLAQKIMMQKQMGLAGGGVIAFKEGTDKTVGDDVKKSYEPTEEDKKLTDSFKESNKNIGDFFTDTVPKALHRITTPGMVESLLPSKSFITQSPQEQAAKYYPDIVNKQRGDLTGPFETKPPLNPSLAPAPATAQAPTGFGVTGSWGDPTKVSNQAPAQVPAQVPARAPAQNAGQNQSPIAQQRTEDTLAKVETMSAKTAIDKQLNFVDELKNAMKGLTTPEQAGKDFDARYQKEVGPSTMKEDIAAQKERATKVVDSFITKNKLATAQMFATMATTPGSFLTAAMTGVKSALPQLILNVDKRDEAIGHIDDAIASIKKADRLEKIGKFGDKYKVEQNAKKSILEMQKIYYESIKDLATHTMDNETRRYVADQTLKGHEISAGATLGAAALRANVDKSMLEWDKATKGYNSVVNENDKVRASKSYLDLEREIKIYSGVKSDTAKQKVQQAQTKKDEIDNRLNKREAEAKSYVDALTPQKLRNKLDANKPLTYNPNTGKLE